MNRKRLILTTALPLALFPANAFAENTKPGEADAAIVASASVPDDAGEVEAKANAAEPSPAKPESKSGIELRPRWRVQYDVGKVSAPDNVRASGMGWNDMLRRAQVGVDAKFGGGWSARFDADMAAPDPEIVDAYIAYDTKHLNITVGQQKVFQSLDDMTSDLSTSFAERAAFVQAFAFNRRLGVTSTLKRGDLALQGGIGTEPLIGLNDVKTNSLGIDGRIVWAPKMGETQIHLAASAHWRDRNDLANSGLRYRARPFVRTTDTRFVSTPSLRVEKELGYGLEAGAVRGRFHATGEAYWVRPDLVSGANPTLWGGYAEVGLFLTKDSRPYKGGAWGTIKPEKPLGSGGIGALQVNARYDYLDLNSGGFKGGKQNAWLGSIIWTPIEQVRFSANYARLNYKDAVIAATNGDRDYKVDSMLFRFQIFY